MLNNEIVKHLLDKQLHNHREVGLYGTGIWANRIMDFIDELQHNSKIVAVIDKDDSEMIGKTFRGYRVERLEEAIHRTDAILITSRGYWNSIYERLDAYFAGRSQLKVPVLSVFPDRAVNRRKECDLEDYKAYVNYVEESRNNKRKYFVDLTKVPYSRKSNDTKIIAWYLPQYYQIEINDYYYGRGFTEWTNSSQAIPLYVGHQQPHIPYDVGYYSLENVETMRRQAELAKMYGIFGFCFHYYWFSGKRIMEKPLYMFLEHKEIDMPFCLDWATENWTSTWDGGKDNLIFEQQLKEDDDEKFMKDILPFFQDSRYIKIDGKPVLVIYELKIFEKERFLKLVKNFRRIAKENGFKDLFILLTNHDAYDVDAVEYGADGMAEFPPSEICCKEYVPKGYLNPYYAGKIFDLQEFLLRKGYIQQYKSKKIFRSAMVSFDNTARKTGLPAVIFHGASPKGFHRWLADILRESKEIHEPEEDIVFVNSWNEWAEGSHLEPDIRNGYAYLEAVKQALYESRPLDTGYIDRKIMEVVSKGCIPHIYIMCIESLGDIVACEPLGRILRQKKAEMRITWVVKRQYVEIVKYNPYIDEVKEVAHLAEAEEYCRNQEKEEGAIVVDCHYNGRICTTTGKVHVNLVNPMINEDTYCNYGSLLENFGLTAGLERCTLAPVFYEKAGEKNILNQKNYIVFHCKSAEQCKDWREAAWNELAEKLIAQGFQVAEVGLQPMIAMENAGYLDCTGIHDIQKIVQIIKGAQAFVGIDSAFAHIANCYCKKAVIIMGKYKNFERPMPYTGFYAKHSKEMIVYADEGAAIHVGLSQVYKRLLSILERSYSE